MDIASYLNIELAKKEITLEMKQRSLACLNSEDSQGYLIKLHKLLEERLNKLLKNNSEENHGVVLGIMECMQIQKQFKWDLKKADDKR